MVPMARLELARVTPLPPQDSVSTNSTTSAYQLKSLKCRVTLFFQALRFLTCFIPGYLRLAPLEPHLSTVPCPESAE